MFAAVSDYTVQFTPDFRTDDFCLRKRRMAPAGAPVSLMGEPKQSGRFQFFSPLAAPAIKQLRGLNKG